MEFGRNNFEVICPVGVFFSAGFFISFNDKCIRPGILNTWHFVGVFLLPDNQFSISLFIGLTKLTKGYRCETRSCQDDQAKNAVCFFLIFRSAFLKIKETSFLFLCQPVFEDIFSCNRR